MKFSKLEQEQIKKLCEWAKEANQFMPIRDYYACSGLEKGTGVICIYDENARQPKSILYVDEDKCKEDDFEKIREYENNCIFRFSFIYKLERLGLITISKTSYPNTDSKGWACFSGYPKAAPIDIVEEFSNDYIILFTYGRDKIVAMESFGDLYNKVTSELLNYSHKEISSKLDIFGLVTSVVSIEQELFELTENNFKSYEDIQLEEVQTQTKAAQESLKEAQRQTKWSIGAFVLSVLAIIASIIVPQCVESTINQNQFDTLKILQKELNEGMKDLKNKQTDKDSAIKLLNLTNKSIDEISNTLKEVKELKSK